VPAHRVQWRIFGGAMSSNLARILVDTAAQHAGSVACNLDEAELTWQALDDASARVAALLRGTGFQPGDRVGVMLPNVPYFPVVYYGVLRAGGVVVPMNVLLRRREIAFYLEDSGSRHLFVWHGFADEAEAGARDAGAEVVRVAPGEFEVLLGGVEPLTELADREPDDTAVILYTSGTTGTPKGAELTHDNLYRNAEVSGRTLLKLGPDDVVLGALPLFHSFGQTCAMNASTLYGARLTFIPRFDAGKALEILQRDGVSIFMGVPTMYNALLHHPSCEATDTSALRLCVSGGAAMPVELMRAFEAAFDAKIVEGYGLSETSPVSHFNHPDRERKPGSIGTPIEGVESKVVDDDGNEVGTDDVGEIIIRGHNVMKGYWNQPDATEEAMRGGWFHTGDIAKLDADGYFFIVDRKKDLIIRGGYNVYPRELEEVLYEHPAVLECAVIGIPDEQLGEEVAAVVALKPGQQATPEELRDHLKRQVAAYKYPRKVWLVDELPKTATGKIMKREIQVPETVVAS
jgi:long-chain acyl-CoA synthetase